MPLYEYRCTQHGVFDALVPINERGEKAPCPRCGLLAIRVIITPPRAAQLSQARRQAHERNERAAHEPLQGNLSSEWQEQRLHKPLHPSKTLYTPDGKKMFPTSRPWMLGH